MRQQMSPLEIGRAYAKLSTTVIYAAASGPEERAMAKKF